jgi:segregation and condensation protein B
MSGQDGTAGEAPPGADELVAAVEAVMFAAAEPVPAGEIAGALGNLDEAAVEAAIETLRQRLEAGAGGLRLERVAGGWRLATRPEVGAWVRRFFRQRNRTRLSPAALETLAIVAYKQPITAPEIQAIRGVDPAHGLKSLLEKRMVRILGRKKVVGNPLLYGTTKQFLVHFGLDRLADLPSLEDFDQFLGALQGGGGGLFAESEPSAIVEDPEATAFDDLPEDAGQGDEEE